MITKTNEEFSKYMEDQLRKLQLLRDLMKKQAQTFGWPILNGGRK